MSGSLPGLMMDRPLLVIPLLQFAAQYHSDTAVITRSVEGPVHRITYEALYRRTCKLANALIALGVKPGDRVATLAWNTWRHVELYYAIAGIGAVCHTLNPRLSPEQTRFVVDDAEDRVLFFDATFADAIAANCSGRPSVLARVALCAKPHLPTHAALSDVVAYEDLIAAQPDTFDWPTFDENTAASLCYTSGTTGNPKGVLYSHRALVLHSFAMVATFWLSPDEVCMPVVPMFHVNAWGIPYSAPMTGTSMVLPGPRLDGASLFELMDAEGVTCALGVPTVWLSLLDHMRKAGRKPAALRRVLVGGSAVPQSIVDAFEMEFGVSVIQGWGMTETAPLGVLNTLKPKFAKLPREQQIKTKLKQGRAVFGVELRIVDEAGRVQPRDGVASGHLQVRGPWVAKAYFKGAASPLTADGWFDTGDVATIDPDGYLQITDRAKDIIKSGGEWISSVDLENAAMGCPGIAQAAVIGVPHPKWQERPLLICVAKEGARPTLEQVHAYLSARVPKWWLPDAVAFVDALPVGPTGKIQKNQLREKFADHPLC